MKAPRYGPHIYSSHDTAIVSVVIIAHSSKNSLSFCYLTLVNASAIVFEGAHIVHTHTDIHRAGDLENL